MNVATGLARRVPRIVRGIAAEARLYSWALPSIHRSRPYTMGWTSSLMDLAGKVQIVLDEGIPGAFVECGVWKGGCSFLMADLLRQSNVRDRMVWLADSFEGLPPPDPIDGIAAQQYPESLWYFDNCAAGREEAQRTARLLGLANLTSWIPGWFDQTLVAHRERIGPIAILRIDADWHASVKCCLEALYDQVVPGGYVIFDDYYAWEGCAIAVHEFLAERKAPHRLITGRAASTAYIRKWPALSAASAV